MCLLNSPRICPGEKDCQPVGSFIQALTRNSSLPGPMQHLYRTFSPSQWRLICAYVHHIAPRCAAPRKMLRPSPFGYVAGIAVIRRVAPSQGACSTKIHTIDSVYTAMRRLKLIVGVGGSRSAYCWRTSATALGAPVKLIRAASIGGFSVLDSLRFLFCGLGQLLRSCRTVDARRLPGRVSLRSTALPARGVRP